MTMEQPGTGGTEIPGSWLHLLRSPILRPRSTHKFHGSQAMSEPEHFSSGHIWFQTDHSRFNLTQFPSNTGNHTHLLKFLIVTRLSVDATVPITDNSLVRKFIRLWGSIKSSTMRSNLPVIIETDRTLGSSDTFWAVSFHFLFICSVINM